MVWGDFVEIFEERDRGAGIVVEELRLDKNRIVNFFIDGGIFGVSFPGVVVDFEEIIERQKAEIVTSEVIF